MNVSTLLADPNAIGFEKFISNADSITIVVRSCQKTVCCPLCDEPTNSLHSNYSRRTADLPWHDVAIRLELHTRKFRCRNELCRRKVFCERLPKVVAAYARKTVRLNAAMTLLAFALGGEAGARTASGLGLTVSGDSLLRRIRHNSVEVSTPSETPRVLGVDDFAFRRGQRYGTILVDLEKRRVVDLLPDREVETVSNWLKAHPGVEIVTRDRSLQYAEGITLGAPEAGQVADRWHLLKNVVDVLKEFLNGQITELQKARQTIINRQTEQSKTRKMPTDRRTRAREQTRRKRLELYHRVKTLKDEGATRKEIVRRLGISKTYAKRLIEAETFPERSPFPQRRTSVDIYADYLRKRWAEGCQNATQLWGEIKEQGFQGALGAVVRYVRLRMREPTEIKRHWMHRMKLSAIKMKLPSARRAAWLLLKNEEQLTDEERLFINEIQKSSVEISRAASMTRKFQELVKMRDIGQFEEWLSEAEKLGTKWKNFVKGLRQDFKAVKAALTSEWSNGQTEGQVNRLKLLKRQMYGRANFDLLRARVLRQG